MLNVLVFLSSTAPSDSVPKKIYSLGEAIFFYVVCLAVIVLFVFYILKLGSKKKYFSNLMMRLERDITKYVDIIKRVNNKEIALNKISLRGKLSKTATLLNLFDNAFVEYKEKTRLDDFDKLQNEKDQIVSFIKTLEKQNEEVTIDEIESLQEKLSHLKGQIELVRDILTR